MKIFCLSPHPVFFFFFSSCSLTFKFTLTVTVHGRCEQHGQLRAGPPPHPLQELAHGDALRQEVQAGLLRTQRSLYQQ